MPITRRRHRRWVTTGPSLRAGSKIEPCREVYNRGRRNVAFAIQFGAFIDDWVGLRMGENDQWADWLRGGSPWKGPLLALLLERPGHSYDLAGRLANRVGSAWKLELNDADRVLRRAEQLGLADSKLARSKRTRRPVQVFEPTPLTGTAVEHWIASPLVEDPYRFEMWTRIVVSGPEHADTLLGALRVCERRLFDLLREYSKPHPTDTWAGLELEVARDGVEMRLQADLQWIEKTRGKIKEYVQKHGAA